MRELQSAMALPFMLTTEAGIIIEVSPEFCKAPEPMLFRLESAANDTDVKLLQPRKA